MSHACYIVNMLPSTVVDLQTQRRYGEKSLWIIQAYGFSVAQHTILLIVRKRTRVGLRDALSSDSPKESRVSDFEILSKECLYKQKCGL